MALQTYRKKRDFKKTSEPFGKKKRTKEKYLYVIQKHAASHLHYDFRLELDGVLKSWAVPKGPSLDPTVKRLAVHVEDHPIEYGSFEGIIPKGQYGGGTVMLWDTGTWEPQDEDPEAAYKKGSLKFILKGKKLKGLWKLVQIKSDPKNWLLIKGNDKYARPSTDYDITDDKPLSAASKKSMEKITEKYTHVWTDSGSRKRKKDNSASEKKSKKLAAAIKIMDLENIKKSKMPENISPELCTLVDEPPSNKEWLHEIKFDGYRLICYIKNNKVTFMTRGKQNWTRKFQSIANALEKLKLPNAILDGEVVALDEKLRYNFGLLQARLSEKSDSDLIYYIFDIIYCDGYDLSDVPLQKRKNFLKQFISSAGDDYVRYSDHIIGNGPAVFKKSCQLNLEGIVSKSIDSPYTQRRTREWLKMKCKKRQEFVVTGFTKPGGKRNYFGSLLLGTFSKDKKLQYRGHVGTGFDETTLEAMSKLLKKYITQKMPFKSLPPDVKNVTWVKPKLVVEVEFAEITRDGILRQPSFKGIRNDKPAKKIVIETPHSLDEIKSMNTLKRNDFSLSNPDRILYPEANITKLDLAEYYEEIHQWILPYIINRPLTLLRCPKGWNNKCFYQKHLHDISTKHLYKIDIKEKSKTRTYTYIKDLDGLLSLVQLGVLEIHAWGCHIDDIEHPDMITFDLDPAPDVPWSKVMQCAKFIRKQLTAIKLNSFVKTTGGKGLHIVVPIKPYYDWSQIKDFTHAFVAALVAQNPHDFVSTITKSKRKGKIFIDYLRNQRGATAVAAYSTRARENCPVSTPLSWEELSSKIKSNTFTIQNLPKRLKKLKKDPWAGFLKLKQSLKFKL